MSADPHAMGSILRCRVYTQGFGLMSMNGIRKPARHACRFLHLLGDVIVSRQEKSIVPPLAAYPDHDGARDIQHRSESRTLSVALTRLQPGAVFALERMAEEDTAVHLWDSMGRPASLTRAQESALLAAAPRKIYLQADAQGRLTLDTTLAPWEILCLYQIS